MDEESRDIDDASLATTYEVADAIGSDDMTEASTRDVAATDVMAISENGKDQKQKALELLLSSSEDPRVDTLVETIKDLRAIDSVILDKLRSIATDSKLAELQCRLDTVVKEVPAMVQRIGEGLPELIQKALPPVTRIEIQKPDGEVVTTGLLAHEKLPTISQILSMGENAMLVGPSGSGKTFMAQQIAEMMERPFYMSGAVLQKYELLGFVNAQGDYIRTSFRDAYENGGLFLWDEVDASNPSAFVAFNAALENGHCDFPDGMVKRHPNFICIAAANTYGKGADRVYVGRNQLDGASIERFIVVDLDYDQKLERALSVVDGNDAIGDKWVTQVQAWRAAADAEKIRHIISPRASMKGAKFLRAGMDRADVEAMVVWKGLDKAQVDKIKVAA